MGSSSGSLPRGSGPQRVPWDTHLFSPGAGGGWHLPEAPGKEPPQPVQSPRMMSLRVPHLVGYHGERLLRAQPGEKRCRDGKSRPAEPRGEVCRAQEPRRPRPLCTRPASGGSPGAAEGPQVRPQALGTRSSSQWAASASALPCRPRRGSTAPGPASCALGQGPASYLRGSDTALTVPGQRLPAWWIIVRNWTRYHGSSN